MSRGVPDGAASMPITHAVCFAAATDGLVHSQSMLLSIPAMLIHSCHSCPVSPQGPEDYLAVLLARSDCLRHQLPSPANPSSPPAQKLRAWFTHSRNTMAQYFPDYLDRSLRLPAYCAHVEGVLLADLEAMRAVWEATVKSRLGRSAVDSIGFLSFCFYGCFDGLLVELDICLRCLSNGSHRVRRPGAVCVGCQRERRA